MCILLLSLFLLQVWRKYVVKLENLIILVLYRFNINFIHTSSRVWHSLAYHIINGAKTFIYPHKDNISNGCFTFQLMNYGILYIRTWNAQFKLISKIMNRYPQSFFIWTLIIFKLPTFLKVSLKLSYIFVKVFIMLKYFSCYGNWWILFHHREENSNVRVVI